MPDQEEKTAIRPVLVVQQAWSIGWKNLSQLSAIYLIFNLPVTIISWLPMFRLTPDQKPSLPVILWLLCSLVIGSWGQITLLLGAYKAIVAQDYTISQTIGQAKAFLLKYLALILSVALAIIGILVVAGISVTVVVAFLSQVNKMLVRPVSLILIMAVITGLIFIALRWSLGGLVCVLEGSGPISALKRSSALVKGHINPVAGTYGLLGLAYFVGLIPMAAINISGALSGKSPEVASYSQLGMIIYVVLINIVLVPFITMATVVLYKKLNEVSGNHVYA